MWLLCVLPLSPREDPQAPALLLHSRQMVARKKDKKQVTVDRPHF